MTRIKYICILAAIAAFTAASFNWRLVAKSPTGPGNQIAKQTVSPATIKATVNEATLNAIELSPQAFDRLGLKLHAVELRSMPRHRSYGAELTLPTGAAVIVAAPLSGTLRNPNGVGFPQVGQPVQEGETLLKLLPMLTPEREVLTPAERIRFAEAKATVAQTQIDANGQFEQATVQLEAARIALARAERLFSENVGTRRAVDDAQAQFELAKQALAASEERKKLVDNINLDEDAGTLEPLDIVSPLKGIVRVTHVQAGQIVASGAPLFEVMNDSMMWVKVPVYVGELNDISADRPARLTLLDGVQSEQDVIANPVSLPPTAIPQSSAVDLYYEVANLDHEYRPGQRIAANIPLNEDTEVKAVPWAAVFHDVYGGQWVYEEVETYKYARHRIEVGWIADGWAALLRGPEVGTVVVTAGVAELSGVEFGFAK